MKLSKKGRTRSRFYGDPIEKKLKRKVIKSVKFVQNPAQVRFDN